MPAIVFRMAWGPAGRREPAGGTAAAETQTAVLGPFFYGPEIFWAFLPETLPRSPRKVPEKGEVSGT